MSTNLAADLRASLALVERPAAASRAPHELIRKAISAAIVELADLSRVVDMYKAEFRADPFGGHMEDAGTARMYSALMKEIARPIDEMFAAIIKAGNDQVGCLQPGDLRDSRRIVSIEIGENWASLFAGFANDYEDEDRPAIDEKTLTERLVSALRRVRDQHAPIGV